MPMGEVAREMPAVEQVALRIDEISSLPHIAARVLEVVSDDRSGATELKAVMESDVALSTRVLRCVNSSAYGLRNKVTNLQLAIAYLGFKEIRNLAVTASVSEIFRQDVALGNYSRTGLWHHLVATGVCARMIALRQRLPIFEDCFLAGLLHDLGIVLEDQHLHHDFQEMMENLDQTSTLSENEHRRFGFDHAMLGEQIAERWRMPKSIQMAIRHHHNSAAYQGEFIDLVRCVEVANLLCTMKGIPSIGLNLLRPQRAGIDGLKLQRHDLEVLMSDLEREMQKYEHLLSL